MNKNIFKSIWAVLAGTLLGIALSLGTDYFLESAGVFPPTTSGLFTTWMLVLATLYRCAYTLLGGYTAAALAPSKPMKHVIILGSIALLANLGGLIGTWNQNLGPHWYPIALTILALPSAWIGGKMQTRKPIIRTTGTN